MKEFGEQIKECRKSLSITQRELAILVGVGVNSISKIERGDANISLRVILRILNKLGLKMEIIINSNRLSL